ncbi:MAG: Shikimate dehydrogenase [Acidobacteria bacterium]|nr:Shikimate dehydrogenase [Acidobacteriota bacterium]
MNNGKICVSVCAASADELIEQIKRAEKLADVIEIRFDCLKDIEEANLWRIIGTASQNFKGKLLATFRPSEQGGKRNLSFAERENFWLHSHVFEFVDWADLEWDFSEDKINSLWGKAFEKVIKSFHDFSAVPGNLDEIYENLSAGGAVAKIAVQTGDITDSLAVWKLLERAKKENKQVIPIAMGEAGKWTRILGLAHGAPITYASLDAGSATAPGQISAGDLTGVYRVKELDRNAEVYGIVGGNTSYSTSPYMHNAAFKFHNLNAVYVPFQVKNLDNFVNVFLKESGLNVMGLSVTIPHKEAIIKYLDELDETAEKIGAVNTVKIENGKLFGYNTDAHGFIEPLRNAYGNPEAAKVAVLGAGGAARACVYALKQEKADVTIFARDLQKAEALADEFQVELKEFNIEDSAAVVFNDFDILVNTTPLGTKGELQNKTPVKAEQIESVKLVYDLVYNPFQTSLMTEADKASVPKIGGMAMLISQGMKQFEIWTGRKAPMKEMSAAVSERLY